MVAEIRPGYGTERAAMEAVASKPGIGTAETVRQWVRRDQIDPSTCHSARLRPPSVRSNSLAHRTRSVTRAVRVHMTLASA